MHMERIAALFVRHRLLLTCCVLAYTGICLYGITRVSFDNDPLRLLQSDEIELKLLDDEFAHLERTAMIVVQGQDLLTPQAVDRLRGIVRGAKAVEGVQAVYSMLNLRGDRRVGSYLLPLFIPDASPESFERSRRQAMSHPLLIGHLLTEDLKTSLVIVHFDARLAGPAQYERVLEQLQAMLAEHTESSGLRARITGPTALEVQIQKDMAGDISLLTNLGAGLVVGIAVVMFRRIGAALLVAAGPGVGAIWTIGTLGLIGEPINMLTQVVPILVLVIGFTDSMHLVLHVRRAMAEGASGPQAAQSAVAHLGLACALTSLSTAVGFGSLMLASLYIIQSFGWCSALGSVLSFLAVITVVPLLASTRLSRYVVATRPARSRALLGPLADGLLGGLLRRRRIVLAGGAVLTLALALLAFRMEPDHTIGNEIPQTSPAYRALLHVDEEFGGVMFAYAVVDWPEQSRRGPQELYDVLEEVHQVFDRSPVLKSPLSLLNLVESLPGRHQSLARRAAGLRYMPQTVLDRMVSSRYRRAVVSVHMPDAGARVLQPAFLEVERQFEQIVRRHPGFRIELSGGSVTGFRSVHLMIEDLWKSLLTAAGVMFLMIWVGLRSLRYALVSLMPNVFPLLCAGAFIVLTGRCLEMSSVIVFSISLGIAVDDTIHFLVRFKREMDSQPDRSRPDSFLAIRRTFRVVGKALVMTTVALVAGHGVVMLSSFPAVQIFGMLTAVTIASALVGDLLILPAILVCLKWPGSPPDRVSTGSGPQP